MMPVRAEKRTRSESLSSMTEDPLPQAAQEPPGPSSPLVTPVNTLQYSQESVSCVEPPPKRPQTQLDVGTVTVTGPVNLDHPSSASHTSLVDESLTFIDPIGLGTSFEFTTDPPQDSSLPSSMRALMSQYKLAISEGLPDPISLPQQDLNRILRVLTVMPPSALKEAKKEWDRLFPMMFHQAVLSLIPLLSVESMLRSEEPTGSSPGTTIQSRMERFSHELPSGLGLTSPLVARLLPRLGPHICRAISDFLMLFASEPSVLLPPSPEEP